MNFVKYILMMSLLNSLWLSEVDCASKKHSKKKVVKKSKSISKQPDGISGGLYCEACQAILQVAFGKLNGVTSDYEVLEVLAKACEIDGLQTFKFPPMEMWKACKAFKEGWEEEIEAVLAKSTLQSELFEV